MSYVRTPCSPANPVTTLRYCCVMVHDANKDTVAT